MDQGSRRPSPDPANQTVVQEAVDPRFHLAAIVESADDAIISKDLNSVIRTWNDAASRIFGYTAEEMVGQSIRELIPPELQSEEDLILSKMRAGERLEHYETVRVRKNGERIQMSISVSPIRDETGRIIGASKIARDISDQKRMERLLVEAEKLAANGRLAASIAHEINNPLESLMNLVYLARQHTLPGSKAHQYLGTAEDELERVSHIARQTLGYYRDTGVPMAVYIHDLIENVFTVYHAKLTSNSISTDMRFEDSEKIVVRKGEILQVLSNIVANSIHAMPRGGTLSVCTQLAERSQSPGVEIMLRDTGTGIRPEQLDHVFEPFFTTKGEVGTGIGLWVARQIVTKRGGDISLTSSTQQGASGTQVTIFLPYETPADDRGGIQ